MSIQAWTIALVSLGAGVSPAQDPADGGGGPLLELTLADAMRMALDRNLELELEALSTEIARFDYLGSWGAFDPVYSVTGSLNNTEAQGSSDLSGAPVLESDSQGLTGQLSVPLQTGGRLDLTYDRDNTRTNNSFSLFDTSTTDVVTLAVTQPLLRNAWERFATADQRESELSLASQRAHTEEIRQRVLLDVATAYWDMVGAVEQLGVRDVALETGARQLDQSRRRLEVGVGTEVDVLQAQTNVAQLTEQRLLAESNLRAAEDALRALLFQRTEGDLVAGAASWDWPISARTALPEVEEFLPGWLASLDIALRNRPELAQQRLQIEVAEVGLDRAGSARLPGLDLTLSASGVGFGEDSGDAMETALGLDFPSYTGSLVFSMPIRNRAARYAERSARAAVRSARIGYDQVELAVLTSVRNAIRDLRYAGENVVAATTSTEFANRQLVAEEARFRSGLSTTFQVLEFQRDLAEASSALTTARAGYAKALVALQHAEGRLLGPDGVEGVSLPDTDG